MNIGSVQILAQSQKSFVVHPLRDAVSGRPKGLHYIRNDFFTGFLDCRRRSAELLERARELCGDLVRIAVFNLASLEHVDEPALLE